MLATDGLIRSNDSLRKGICHMVTHSPLLCDYPCRLIFLFVLALSLINPASAQTRLIFEPPATALSIHSYAHDVPVYGQARNSAAWHVSQWNNPMGDVPDFLDGRTSNGALAIDVREAPLEFTITQNSKALRCEDGLGPREFDGLIGTNTKQNNPNSRSAKLRYNEEKTLDDFGELVQKISMRVGRAEVLDNSCKTSKAVSLVAIVLDNTVNRSTLFLQIILYALNADPKEFWWAVGKNGNRFGYNFVRYRVAADNAENRYSEDLLPKIIQLIKLNKVGMDPEPRNWKVSGAYFGNAVYGHVTLSTTWSQYSLEAAPRR